MTFPFLANTEFLNARETNSFSSFWGSGIWNPKNKVNNNKKKISKTAKRIRVRIALRSKRINRKK